MLLMMNFYLVLSSISYKLIMNFLWYCFDSCTKIGIKVQIFIAHDNCLIGVKHFFNDSISYPEYTYAITVIESSRTWTFLWIEGNCPYVYSLYLVRYENKSFYFSVIIFDSIIIYASEYSIKTITYIKTNSI